MWSRTKTLGVAAAATLISLSGGGAAVLAVPNDGASSTADAGLAVEGCVVESSKDISYIEYFSGGASQGKDESINARSFDLTTVEGIEDVDSIEVKSSTTVEQFAIDCSSGA